MNKVSVLEQKWMKRFAKNLAHAMEEAGMSQAELADRAGLSRGTVCKYLSGERRPMAYHLYKIAATLDISVDDLIS